MAERRKEFLWEDGRRAERVVIDDNECEGVSVTELYVEPKIEKKLAQRITERRKPVVYEREIEHIDEATGEVLEKVLEGTEPRPQLRVLERQLVQPLAAQNVTEDCNCNVTRDELREDILAAIKALKSNEPSESFGFAAQSSRASQVSAQSVIEDRLEAKKNTVSSFNIILLAVIAAQVAGLAWVLFVM